MAYLDALHLDDGLDLGRLSAKALAYDSSTGWGGGRVIRPRNRPLHGFWLKIAQAVNAGCETEDEIAAGLCCRPIEVKRAVHSMARLAHLHRNGDRLRVTTRTKRQLVAEARR